MWPGGMHDGGCMMGACVVVVEEGLHGGGSLHGRGCAWQGNMHGRVGGHYGQQDAPYWNAFSLR